MLMTMKGRECSRYQISFLLNRQEIFSRLSSKVRGTMDVTGDKNLRENQACREARETEELQNEIMTLVG